jgi:hypothetical protein
VVADPLCRLLKSAKKAIRLRQGFRLRQDSGATGWRDRLKMKKLNQIKPD